MKIVRRKATLSPCGTYRYWLEREWAADPMCMKGFVNWIMLNPSTADADVDDPTIRKCMEFTSRWGYDGMHVVNLFALRSTDPWKLVLHPDPVGPDNAAMIEASFLSAEFTVCAWGAHRLARGENDRVITIAEKAKAKLFALRLNGDGSPKHPLYIPYSAQLIPFGR